MALRNVIHICISCHESNYTFQLTTEHGFIMHKFFHILTIVVSYGKIVHVLLKRAARIILDCDVSVPSIVLFSKHRWMTFPERVIYQNAVKHQTTRKHLSLSPRTYIPKCYGHHLHINYTSLNLTWRYLATPSFFLTAQFGTL